MCEFRRLGYDFMKYCMKHTLEWTKKSSNIPCPIRASPLSLSNLETTYNKSGTLISARVHPALALDVRRQPAFLRLQCPQPMKLTPSHPRSPTPSLRIRLVARPGCERQ